jgi:hypothetical protein
MGPMSCPGWTFSGGRLVEELGGRDHGLRAACFRAEVFLDGVLLQLTEHVFDDSSDIDIDIDVQRRVTEHLGLPVG